MYTFTSLIGIAESMGTDVKNNLLPWEKISILVYEDIYMYVKSQWEGGKDCFGDKLQVLFTHYDNITENFSSKFIRS